MLQIIHLRHGCNYPALCYWLKLYSTESYPACQLLGLLLQSLWALQKMRGKKGLGAVSLLPSHRLKAAIN